ncbi:MAG TPA: hypothetical protein VGG63_20575 [Steroidobacteraceae bacterium]|jgi:hypothetical protein
MKPPCSSPSSSKLSPSNLETRYSAHILRAHRARESEHDRLYREQRLLEAQHSLPFDDDPF